MRCDVVAVGTELLLGQIVDTNSALIGERLAAHGIASRLQVKVGDNVERIEQVFRQLLVDADALIVCGGLGPTHDDVTREAIAALMGVELELDDAVADVIRDLFAQLRREMPDNNLRQAMVPAGATVIPQRRGTAPGLICPFQLDGSDRVIYAIPGVPDEMEEMLERAVLPDLLARAGEPTVIASRILKVWGETESGLNARLDDVISRLDDDGDVTLAFLARGWNGLEIRLTTSAESTAAAEDKLRPWEEEIRALLGKAVFGSDGDTDGVGGARCLAQARMDARDRRVAHRRSGRRSLGERSRCQRRAARLAGHVRQRRQVRPAGRHAGPGDQRGSGVGDGRGSVPCARRRRRAGLDRGRRS